MKVSASNGCFVIVQYGLSHGKDGKNVWAVSGVSEATCE